METILLIHHCDSWGGAGVSLSSLIDMLKNDYHVVVVVPHSGSAVYNKVINQGVDVIALEMPIGMISAYSGGPKTFSRTFVRNYFRIFKSRKALKEIIQKIRPQIIAVNSMTLSWVGKTFKKVAECICFVRETYVNNLGMRIIKNQLRNDFHKVIFISEFDRKKFDLPNPTAVVRDSVSLEKMKTAHTKAQSQKELGLPNKKRYLLFVGGDDPIKGLKLLQSAFQHISSKDIVCIVAGNVVEANKGDNPNFIYIGKRNDMIDVYNAAEVLVFPVVFAHQGRPIFEAGFFGVPVIIPDFVELAECVSHEHNGLVFKNGNPQDLSVCIERLFVENDLYNKCSEQNYKNARQKHEQNACKNTLLQFLTNGK